MNGDSTLTPPRRFGRIRSRTPVLVALGATLLALALAIGQTILSQREARAIGRANSDALLALHEVLEATLDAETGQRGYLLTKNETYLQPYASARQRLDASLEKLRGVLRSDPTATDEGSMDRLEGLIDEKVAELDRTITLTRGGRTAEALAIVEQDVGKSQMDAIRNEASALMEEKRKARVTAIDRISRLESTLPPLMGVLGLLVLGLVVLALTTEQKRAQAAAKAEQADALRVANERASLLARELNHRVKNLFSVILSIVSLSSRSKASKEVVIEDIRARVRALSLAHVATQGEDGDGDVDLRTVISATLQPYADYDSERVTIDGPDLQIPSRMTTPLGLIVHELATNAAKYGAFSAAGGTVRVSWNATPLAEGGQQVAIRWQETGGPAPDLAGSDPATAGFGSRMITLATTQMGGTLKREWPETGAVAHFEFPVS